MSANYESFMKMNVDKYVGEWIAICDQNVVSHGKDVKAVVAKAARQCPGKTPLIARIPDKDTMIF